MEEILLKLRRLTQQVKDSSAQTITDLKPTIDGIKTNFDELTLNVGETADAGGGVNEGTAMAKLNKLLSEMPMYENYDIQKTNYATVTSSSREFLNISGEAVLIGYWIFNSSNGIEEDAITVKTYTDGLLMYDLGIDADTGSSSSGGTSRFFSCFDDNFLIHPYDTPYSFDAKNESSYVIVPSENHAVLSQSYRRPFILVKPPISKNSLIVEASINPKLKGIVMMVSILYGVKK